MKQSLSQFEKLFIAQTKQPTRQKIVTLPNCANYNSNHIITYTPEYVQWLSNITTQLMNANLETMV